MSGWLVLIEIVLVFGAVLAFGWWQLKAVRKAKAPPDERDKP
ncbi:MAG: hypothetical protein ACFB3T_05660 [Geminicoccaceae bacterium]